VPVFAGSSKPLHKAPHFKPDIHGASGLEGTDELSNQPTVVPSQIEIDDAKGLNKAIWEAVTTYGSELSIVAVGPLTNLAKFFTEYPDAKRIIKKLSIMGGGFDGVYNMGYSEFNIWCDPSATNYILEDIQLAPKVILSPLNVTHTVICDSKIQSQIQNGIYGTTKLRKTYYELMMFFAKAYAERQDFKKGPPVHDPVAVYILLEEYGISNIASQYKKLKLHCIEQGEEEGKFEYKEDDINGSKVIFKIDVDSFWQHFISSLKLADEYVLHGDEMNIILDG
jgi:uridine nucleosidase